MSHTGFFTPVMVVVASVLLQGCLEVNTSTRVRTDGSVERTVEIRGDSAEIARGLRMMAIDSTWTVARFDSAGKTVRVSATKEVVRASELSRRAGGDGSGCLRSDVTLEEHFRWFTTGYTFREIQRAWNPFDTIPLSRYFSEQEITLIKKHLLRKEPYASVEDSLAVNRMDERGEEWLSRNLFEGFFGEFIRGVAVLNDPAHTVAAVEAQKESLYKRVVPKAPLAESKALVPACEEMFGAGFTRRVMEANASGFERQRVREEFYEDASSGSYASNVEMPGVIIETNAPEVEGNRVTWKDYRDKAMIDDYEMLVQSRVVNWWAVVVTVCAAAAAVVVLVLGGLRRRAPLHGAGA